MRKTWVAKASLAVAMLMAAPMLGTVLGTNFGAAAADCTKWQSFNLIIVIGGGAYCYGAGTGCNVCIEAT
jgi:hypothetical protein